MTQPIPHSSNRVLASLAEADLKALLPQLRFVDLPQGMVLFEAGGTISHIYFPHAGVVSLVVELASGEMIEAAMIGREGVVGGLSALDSNISIKQGDRSNRILGHICCSLSESSSCRYTRDNLRYGAARSAISVTAVRANQLPRVVSRADALPGSMLSISMPSRPRSATVTPETGLSKVLADSAVQAPSRL